MCDKVVAIYRLWHYYAAHIIYISWLVYLNHFCLIKILPVLLWEIKTSTVVSRKAKKKQHAYASSGLRDRYSELFTRMAALQL